MVAGSSENKLLCPVCKTAYLDLPESLIENAPVKCSRCGHDMGTWGEIRVVFLQQAGSGVFDVEDGRFKPRPDGAPGS